MRGKADQSLKPQLNGTGDAKYQLRLTTANNFISDSMRDQPLEVWRRSGNAGTCDSLIGPVAGRGNRARNRSLRWRR
jgi:hypothetical protein